MTAPECRSLIERYCPVVEHNIPMYVEYWEGEIRENCLHEPLCCQQRGSCQNAVTRRIFHRTGTAI